jgi:hypothetical protein
VFYSTASGVSLKRDNCIERAFGHTYFAAVTAMHVYEGRLIMVNPNDSFDLAHLLSQATPAGVAVILVNVERTFADGGTYQRQCSFHLAGCTSA